MAINRGNSSTHSKTGQAIQADILAYVRQHKYVAIGLPKGSVLAYKVEIASERGVPDLLMCINGRFVGVEIKGHGDTIKPIQVAQAVRIRTAGGDSFVVKSLRDFKDYLEKEQVK